MAFNLIPLQITYWLSASMSSMGQALFFLPLDDVCVKTPAGNRDYSKICSVILNWRRWLIFM